jgi:hypothetical protein
MPHAYGVTMSKDLTGLFTARAQMRNFPILIVLMVAILGHPGSSICSASKSKQVHKQWVAARCYCNKTSTWLFSFHQYGGYADLYFPCLFLSFPRTLTWSL